MHLSPSQVGQKSCNNVTVNIQLSIQKYYIHFALKYFFFKYIILHKYSFKRMPKSTFFHKGCDKFTMISFNAKGLRKLLYLGYLIFIIINHISS